MDRRLAACAKPARWFSGQGFSPPLRVVMELAVPRFAKSGLRGMPGLGAAA
jgi:hypothetical protein